VVLTRLLVERQLTAAAYTADDIEDLIATATAYGDPDALTGRQRHLAAHAHQLLADLAED